MRHCLRQTSTLPGFLMTLNRLSKELSAHSNQPQHCGRQEARFTASSQPPGSLPPIPPGSDYTPLTRQLSS
jgi:hypothetical protein